MMEYKDWSGKLIEWIGRKKRKKEERKKRKKGKKKEKDMEIKKGKRWEEKNGDDLKNEEWKRKENGNRKMMWERGKRSWMNGIIIRYLRKRKRI